MPKCFSLDFLTTVASAFENDVCAVSAGPHQVQHSARSKEMSQDLHIMTSAFLHEGQKQLGSLINLDCRSGGPERQCWVRNGHERHWRGGSRQDHSVEWCGTVRRALCERDRVLHARIPAPTQANPRAPKRGIQAAQ